MEDLAMEIRLMRARLDISQRVAAEQLGISVTTIQRWENGEQLGSLTPHRVWRVAAWLRQSPHDVLSLIVNTIPEPGRGAGHVEEHAQ